MGKFQEFLQEMLDKIISIRDETCARFNAWLDEYFGFDMSDLDELGAEEDE